MIVVAVISITVPAGVRAAWLVDERGQVVWEGEVLGREVSLRTETGERVRFRGENGETRTEIRSGDTRVKLERSDDQLRLRVKNKAGEEEELGEQQELRIREREEENEVEVEVEDDEFVVRRGQTQARTNLPLSVNLATNELVVTTPAGERVVTVLPNQAVQNMLAANVIDQTGIITLGERLGVPVYEIPGLKRHRFLGFIPVQTEVTAVVSAETGEVLSTENVSLVEQVIGALSF